MDERRVLPGRGAHLHRDPACLELAERRRAFPRALREVGPLDPAEVRAVVAPATDPAAGPAADPAADPAARPTPGPATS